MELKKILKKTDIPKKTRIFLIYLFLLLFIYISCLVSSRFILSRFKPKYKIIKYPLPKEAMMIKDFYQKKEKILAIITKFKFYDPNLVFLPSFFYKEEKVDKAKTKPVSEKVLKKEEGGKPSGLKVNIDIQAIIYSEEKEMRLVKINNVYLREKERLEMLVNGVSVSLYVSSIKKNSVDVILKKDKRMKRLCLRPGNYTL